MSDLIVREHDLGIAAADQAWHGKFEVLGRKLTREDVMTRSSIGDRILPGGDQILPFVSFLDSHDAQVARQAILSDIRTVCWNTISAALLTGQVAVKMRHSGDMDAKMLVAKQTLALIAGQRRLAIHEAGRLIDTKVTDSQFWGWRGSGPDLPPSRDARDNVVLGIPWWWSALHTTMYQTTREPPLIQPARPDDVCDLCGAPARFRLRWYRTWWPYCALHARPHTGR